jgi:hypothetical protein
MSHKNLLSRLFGRRKVFDALRPVDGAPDRLVATETLNLKCRRAQNLPDTLREELLAICRKNAIVSACHLLDVMERPSGEIKFFVELIVDHPAPWQQIGDEMQRVLQRYPEFAERSFVGAGVIKGVVFGEPAYRRAT